MLRAVSRPDDAPGVPTDAASAMPAVDPPADQGWLSDPSLADPSLADPRTRPGAETVPVQPVSWAPPPRAPRGPSRGFFIAYFAAGLTLLLAGTVAVVVLAVQAYGPQEGKPSAAGSAPATPAHTDNESTPAPSTGPNGLALGPQRLAMGKPLAVTGEDGAKFEVTVKAGKFRRSACDRYSVKPKNGGYLPTQIRVKVIEGVPEVSDFDFRFEKPNGQWLDSVGGSGCDANYGALFRRLTAGRTYSTTVVFDVPAAMKGQIVFVWPLRDVVASWKVG
jgi:hypothetical protein